MTGLSTPAELIISVLIMIGAALALIGSWGLVRLPTLMERLHGPTKATTLGLGVMLIASVIFFGIAQGLWSAHELLVSLFLFITAPISANMIAKVHLHRLRAKEEDEVQSPAGLPPPLAGESEWATYETPHKNTPASTSRK